MTMEVDADDTRVLLIISLLNVAPLGYKRRKASKRRGGLYLKDPALSSYRRIGKRLF